jgi:hypothetical protein
VELRRHTSHIILGIDVGLVLEEESGGGGVALSTSMHEHPGSMLDHQQWFRSTGVRKIGHSRGRNVSMPHMILSINVGLVLEEHSGGGGVATHASSKQCRCHILFVLKRCFERKKL